MLVADDGVPVEIAVVAAPIGSDVDVVCPDLPSGSLGLITPINLDAKCTMRKVVAVDLHIIGVEGVANGDQIA